jgi:hypothetical protein
MPELSFGTHFFQDLVEAAIRYLPIYPDDPGVIFNWPFLLNAPNQFAALVPDFADLADTIHVIDVAASANGQLLRVLMNADQDEAIGFLATPGVS